MNPQEIKLVKEEANRSEEYNAQKSEKCKHIVKDAFFPCQKRKNWVLCLFRDVFMGRERHGFISVD